MRQGQGCPWGLGAQAVEAGTEGGSGLGEGRGWPAYWVWTVEGLVVGGAGLGRGHLYFCTPTDLTKHRGHGPLARTHGTKPSVLLRAALGLCPHVAPGRHLPCCSLQPVAKLVGLPRPPTSQRQHACPARSVLPIPFWLIT